MSLISTLSVLWPSLSGHFAEPALPALGLVSVLAVVVIVHRRDGPDHEGHPIDAPTAILRRVAVIQPTVFNVRASRKTERGLVINAARSRSLRAP